MQLAGETPVFARLGQLPLGQPLRDGERQRDERGERVLDSREPDNLVCFAGEKVFANVRGKNVPNADSKKNLYQEIIRDANHDVQGWIKEQESKRQASS